MVDRPGFTAPPVWEYRKHGGLIVAGAREYKGQRFFEVRYWTGEHGDKATHKGVTVPIEAVPDLARAARRLCRRRRAQRAGNRLLAANSGADRSSRKGLPRLPILKLHRDGQQSLPARQCRPFNKGEKRPFAQQWHSVC